MRIKSNTILARVLLVLGIIIIVGGLRYTFDIMVDPPSDNSAIGDAIPIFLGLAPLIYGIVTIRNDIPIRKLGQRKRKTKSVKCNFSITSS